MALYKRNELTEETFAPSVKMITVRTVLYIATQYGQKVSQMDVENDFLNGDMFEEVCKQWPQGFPMNEKEHMVCMLVRLHYALKQAPKAWYFHD